jgi:transketolase
VRNAAINAVIEKCAARNDIFILSGDAGLGVFDDFQKEYSDKFLNMGVAEQNMTGFAAGMSMTGYKVIMYNIIPFLLYRCYEQIRNDICYQKLPVVLIGIGSGITYAPQGMTHYSIEDLGIVQTLPNLVVFSPVDPVEARLAAQYAIDSDKPVYLRLAKRGEPVLHTCNTFDISLPQVIKNGSEVAILFHGSISGEVLKAANQLSMNNIDPMLISVPQIQPLNEDKIMEMLSGVRHVFCVEEHYLHCGLGSILQRIKVDRMAVWDLHLMGIPYRFIHEVKNIDAMRDSFGISSSSIFDNILRILEVKNG